ncbi:uncharacterized protein LOC102809770 [Saccoglossus kowalevskii]|uniref:non-specific serine/threonine protein kinase n=1 Tax=Saccoglossus kowalevskii TaxID=10224 RepID=A0ABM0MI83_SACKO|nr:PREDICTED: uncharacterized protein LOC102809770 [Saccoglossus kowalevskii]
MSFRAVLTKLGKFWPKSVPVVQHGKGRDVVQVAISAKKQQIAQKGRAFGHHFVQQHNPLPTFSFARLYSHCVTRSLASEARRNAISRLMGCRGSLPIFAFIGVTISIAENGGKNGNDDVCSAIRGMFTKNQCHDSENDDITEFGSSVSNYEFGRLIGKGCSAAVHEARLRNDNEDNKSDDEITVITTDENKDTIVTDGVSDDENSVGNCAGSPGGSLRATEIDVLNPNTVDADSECVVVSCQFSSSDSETSFVVLKPSCGLELTESFVVMETNHVFAVSKSGDDALESKDSFVGMPSPTSFSSPGKDDTAALATHQLSTDEDSISDTDSSFIVIKAKSEMDIVVTMETAVIEINEELPNLDISVGKDEITKRFFKDIELYSTHSNSGDNVEDQSALDVEENIVKISHVPSRVGQIVNEDNKDSTSCKYTLAIKMLFNMSVQSDHCKLLSAFERELLPLQQGKMMSDSDVTQKLRIHQRKNLPLHPNIVEMYAVFSDGEIPCMSDALEYYPAVLPSSMNGLGRNKTLFIVMKRYDTTLRQYLQEYGCSSQKVAMLILAQLLEGLFHLNQNDIAHRDLKSDNILLDINQGPRVVISDFGCCLSESSGLFLPYQTEHTDRGGNRSLMAPEVISAIPGVNTTIDYRKSDLWTVGTLAYEILTGRNPFYSECDSLTYTEEQLPRLPEDTNEYLVKIINLLLRRDPSERPTPSVAATMLHLLLWQPEIWQNNLPTEKVVKKWLLSVVANQKICSIGHMIHGQRSNTEITNHLLCQSFLSHVNYDDIMTAVAFLMR